MKKKFGVAMLLIMTMIFLCSCKDESTQQDYEGLIGEAKEQIDSLNTKINQLEASLSEVTNRLDTFHDDNNGANGEGTLNNNPSIAPTTNPDTTIVPDDYNRYRDQVNQLKNAIQKNENKENKQFLEYKKELISLDNQLDQCEEQLEHAFESNNLTWEQYKKRNNELDAIETTLDQAEDLLEKQFKVDDID